MLFWWAFGLSVECKGTIFKEDGLVKALFTLEPRERNKEGVWVAGDLIMSNWLYLWDRRPRIKQGTEAATAA